MLYRGMKIFLGPVVQGVFKVAVTGREHVPTSGPAILAGNHVSFLDHFFVPHVLNRKVIYLAKAQYFTGQGFTGRLTAGFFNALGQKPVDRDSGRAGLAAIATAAEVLAEGNLLGIYPEGTRSPDGRLYRGRVGVARLWVETGAPLLPCAVIGSFEALPPGTKMPKKVRVTVKFGPPLDLSRYEGRKRDARLYREITDDIMKAIQELSGQEYVDAYATDVKERLAAG
ncbi:MAG TPA: lysophospholipid acyltransferase family protein [Sporichthya sp.]|nr:lysophospholipid acyltransferase family protein [Sporichthya sp.]